MTTGFNEAPALSPGKINVNSYLNTEHDMLQ